MARRRDATDQDLVNTDDGRRTVDVDDVDEAVLEGETSFTSLENHLFGSRYFDEADELEGERPDPTTFLHQAPSESDTVVQRNLDEPPPVQVVQVLPPGSRPSLAGPPSIVPDAERHSAGAAAGQGLIAAGGVFAGFSVVAAAGVVALGLVCAVIVWMALRPTVAPAVPAPSPIAAEPAPAQDPAPTLAPTPTPAPPPTPTPVAPAPSDGSPLREGVRFPATFAFNDWKPVNVDTQALFDLLAAMETDCRGPIRITGHTDERGDEIVNDRIAIARAGEVRRMLERQGIDRRRMEVSSANAFRPEVDPNDGGSARAQNRRVTLQCP